MKKELIEKNYQILDHYGMLHQMDIWIEEMSELIKEICKIKRNYDKWEGDIPFRNLNDTRLEITDVQVSLDQMKRALEYSESHQEMDYEYKVDRALREIKEK